MSEKPDEVEIDDDDLELAAGGLKNITSNSTYYFNSTIYFQSNNDNK
ncbi:hypothetical protein [Aurantimicrobium photophilum]|uniref:Uncharacterized protein n=1 Tax=Aurantimicrobium photophilum TaxID=1987356 RepID=A0A2Z3RX14_9MICO|nr:hypothetical protein [Aurantimicrobium photophilum]AWR20694.1 hypothetical protein AURMO_00069 [Aurantimicrobium photophilum]